MTDTISFELLQTLPYEQQRSWIERYYVPGIHDVVLRDLERSVILITNPGSGISTSFAVLEHYHLPDAPLKTSAAPMMFFRYEPTIWPGSPRALYQKDTVNHFAQLMVNFLERLLLMLKSNLERIGQISLGGHEFIAWMVRHYLGERRSELWFRNVESTKNPDLVTLLAKARAGDYDLLYRDDVQGDCIGQIDECLDLVASLGMKGVYALAEINFYDWTLASSEQRQHWQGGLRNLLERLTPFHTPRFGYKIAVPSAMIALKDAKALVKDRAEVIETVWAKDRLDEVIRRLPIDGGPPAISALLTEPAWQALNQDIASIWGTIGPAAMQAVGQWFSQSSPVTLPLMPEQLLSLRKHLYVTGAKLRYGIEQPQTIWRGRTAITLDETHIPVFQALWRHSQNQSTAQNEELVVSTGSNTNLDKIISRIRNRLEPFADTRTYIYLERSQGSGIRLNYCHH